MKTDNCTDCRECKNDKLNGGDCGWPEKLPGTTITFCGDFEKKAEVDE